MARPRVLILCTGNSCRSQMAEGLLRSMAGDRLDVYSAGTHPSTVHPLAIQVMAEIGIDISHQRSKHVDLFRDQSFDYILTVCDRAREACPFFPGPARRLHRDFEDPAKAEGSEAERLQVFRRVRDEIRSWLEEFMAEIDKSRATSF